MPKSSDSPSSLSEAIAKLEDASGSKVQDFKEILEKDYQKIRQALDDLKPHLEDLKQSVESEVKNSKNKVEEKVKESPWVALGVVGLLAFVIGWILGGKRRD